MGSAGAGAAFDEPPAFHFLESGAALGQAQVMGDQDQGRAVVLVDREQKIRDRVPSSTVKIPGRLVGKKNSRVAGESPRYCHPLLLSARHLARIVIETMAQSHVTEGANGALARLGEATDLEGKHDVLQRRQAGQQVERLEYKADSPPAQSRPGVFIQVAEVSPDQLNASGGWPLEAGQQSQKRCFSGPRGSNNGERFARFQFDADIFQNIELAARRLDGITNPLASENST